jgi:hypothetical protein
MNFKDKYDSIDAASMTPEELFAEFGTTEKECVDNALKQVRRQLFLLKAAAGKERNARLKERFVDLINGSGCQSDNLRAILRARMPAFQFRKLDKLSDEQVSQILSDVEILQVLDEGDEN